MTRTKQTTPSVVKHDRHPQRNGFTDPRGMVKKDGAGQHNWGKTVDDEFDDEHDIYEEGQMNLKCFNMPPMKPIQPEVNTGASSPNFEQEFSTATNNNMPIDSRTI
nr:10317_t:CDS:2 [Entrophospora candida]